jgi:transglutaminase-like putative cysteine protease
MMEDLSVYLAPTYFLDFESEGIQSLLAEMELDGLSKTEQTQKVYLKVRDSWWYDPYNLNFSKENYKASNLIKKQGGHCIEKSAILITCLRGLGIPARLHLGKVKNHIGVERLMEKFGTNELTPHGMASVYLNGEWLKLSPAFNASLCEKFNVPPLDFDGKTSSFLQKYNSDGSLFMEYLDDYGHFDDVPLDFIIANVKEHYADVFAKYKDITEIKL